MTQLPLPSPPFPRPAPAVLRVPRQAVRGRGWLLAVLGGLWMIEGRVLSRGTDYSASPGGHHAHLVVWIAGLLVAACVLPWAHLATRAAAAVVVSWSATGYLLTAGQHVPVWGVTESAALLALLGVVVWRTEVRAAVPLGTALAAGVLAAPVRDAEALGATVVAYALVVAAVTAAGLCLRHRDVERARAVAAARDAERRELAGELHDFLAHHVAAMTLLAKATGPVARDERVAASLRDIQEAGDEAMTSARRLLKVLRQERAHRGPLPGLDRTAELVDGFRAGHPGTRVTWSVGPGFDAGLAPELAASVHRIVGEGLANAARHSPDASAVEVTLRRSGERLFVSVRNNGAPAHAYAPRAPEDTGGLGLVGLAERADAIGGSLTAGPLAGGGWEVLAVLPVRQ
ncbi:histidine kinase [Streptomyces sp. NPDC046261]|uniref:sensor histidine kinase n=1 Tax=Streptomyces sp. NPDC046261 TaxID=3157200 RepID=UPI0033D0D962